MFRTVWAVQVVASHAIGFIHVYQSWCHILSTAIVPIKVYEFFSPSRVHVAPKEFADLGPQARSTIALLYFCWILQGVWDDDDDGDDMWFGCL